MKRTLVAMLCVAGLSGLAWGQDKPAEKPKEAPKAEAKKPEAKHDDKHGDAKKGDKAECKLTCPVTGEPISYDAFVREKGQRVYFCCEHCIDKYKASPEKYADKAKAQLAENKPLRVQVACPVTGGKLDKNVFVAEPMYDLFFSSEDAKKQYEADKAKFAGKMKDCFTFQTTCVIMGEPIDPATGKDIGGKKVYFCCPMCEGKFTKDQDANLKKLDEQVKKNEAAYAKLKDEHKGVAGGKKGG